MNVLRLKKSAKKMFVMLFTTSEHSRKLPENLSKTKNELPKKPQSFALN